MKFAIGLFLFAGLLYLFHFYVDTSSFPNANEITSLMMGLGLIGIILSTSCFFMNMGNRQLKKRNKYYLWMTLSVVDFLLFVGYIIVFLIERAHAVGIAFF